MDPNTALLQAMFFALAGWIASCHRIVYSRIKPEHRRWIVVPLWFVWMTLALGGPVYQQIVTPAQALTVGVSFSVGMMIFMIMNARKSRRSR
jgi:hypothetical protein